VHRSPRFTYGGLVPNRSQLDCHGKHSYRSSHERIFAANRLRTVATVGFVFVFRLVWLFEI
jgi:hypothetical protein